jgi:hypothetical protein
LTFTKRFVILKIENKEIKMRRTVTTVFEEVSLRGKKTGKCGCGKNRTRQATFTNTINPYNRDADGTIKSRDEVLEDVRKILNEWKSEPIYCDNCRPPSYWELSETEREEYDQMREVVTKTMNGKSYLMRKKSRI